MAGSGALGRLQRFDVGHGLALVGDQGDEVVALGVARVEIVAGLAEEGEEALEVVDAQTAIGLDQLVQRGGGVVGRLDAEEQLDLREGEKYLGGGARKIEI